MGILKKQGVAWAITAVMILAAIGIGRARAGASNTPAAEPAPSATTAPSASSAPVDAGSASYIYDEADVLSASTEKTLASRNERILREMNVVIGVVTCNYGKSDLGSYAIDQAEEMGLGEYDFIVVLDISGDNYWLVQGATLSSGGWFSDDDCSDYAYKYMEKSFAKGDYDGAVLSLTEALEKWYNDNY